MKIALFTDTYRGDVNGVARTLGMLVDHASRRGHEVFLVTPRCPGGPELSVRFHLRRPGVPVPFYRELHLARGLDGAGSRALADFAPDLVHVATEAPVGLSGRRWALSSGTPLLTSYHTNFPTYLRSYRAGVLEGPLWAYLRWFHRPAEATLCPSRATIASLEEHRFHPRLRVWSRGVDTTLFDPGRRRQEVREQLAPGAERILMYVGRLAPEKKVDLLVEALPRVRAATGPGTALVLVGDGPSRNSLRHMEVDGVHFTGFLRGEELADAYAAADLFIIASETETFGNVALEALASGVPVVAVASGGLTETVIPGVTGQLVPPGDVVALSGACVALLRNGDERDRLRECARSEALRRGWGPILDGVLAVYEEVRSGALHRNEGVPGDAAVPRVG